MEGHETRPIAIEANQWEGLDPEVRQHLCDALAESGHVIVPTEAEIGAETKQSPAQPRQRRPASTRPRAASVADILGPEKAQELREKLANQAARANARALARRRSLSKFKRGLYPRLK